MKPNPSLIAWAASRLQFWGHQSCPNGSGLTVAGRHDQETVSVAKENGLDKVQPHGGVACALWTGGDETVGMLGLLRHPDRHGAEGLVEAA
jgi:hypothetical protein